MFRLRICKVRQGSASAIVKGIPSKLSVQGSSGLPAPEQQVGPVLKRILRRATWLPQDQIFFKSLIHLNGSTLLSDITRNRLSRIKCMDNGEVLFHFKRHDFNSVRDKSIPPMVDNNPGLPNLMKLRFLPKSIRILEHHEAKCRWQTVHAWEWVSVE